ncbi:MAG: hypothetical protein L0196_07760 [candidate division Zixibacteria bacterium]|nr:hypothetical protein [candidate division Zixibacteria bacterium]
MADWQRRRNRLQSELFELSQRQGQVEAQITEIDRCIKDLQDKLGDSLVIPSLPEVKPETIPSEPKMRSFRVITSDDPNQFGTILANILLRTPKMKLSDVPRHLEKEGYSFKAKNAYVSAYGQVKNLPELFELIKENGTLFVQLTSKLREKEDKIEDK